MRELALAPFGAGFEVRELALGEIGSGERRTGQAEVRAFWEEFFAGTDRARFTTEEVFGAGDRVVVRWRFDWGEGATGGHVRGVDVMRVRGGKVAEKLAYVKG